VAEVDELREALEREYPRLEERNGDWNDVVRRAQAAAPRRRRRTVRLAVAGVALAALAIALVAPWRSDNGIVGRAAAALGDGPVIHVVVRADMKTRRVDLRTGKSQPAYEEQEFWWDPARGLHVIARFDGMPYRDTLSRTLPPPEDDPLPVGFVTGYRDALESGRAKVIGDGEINGHEVTWIRFSPGGNSTFDVAVDRSSAKPVFTRYTPAFGPRPPHAPPGRVRPPRYERTVLLAESLPRGSGNFDVNPVPPPTKLPPFGGGGFGAGERVTPERARAILGKTPLWLGPRYEGDNFAGFRAVYTRRLLRQDCCHFTIPVNEPRNRLDVGVEAVYGLAFRPGPARGGWVRVAQYPRLRNEAGFMGPNEARIWRTARAGSILVDETGDPFSIPGAPIVVGYTRRDGLYVKIFARDVDAVVSAARALRLLR
jgi:hypothetical protein